MVTVAAHPSIELDNRDVAWLKGTNTKVREVVLDHLAHGWDADEIHSQHPHLSLSQIHSAFAYYYDNHDAVDAEIEHADAEAQGLAEANESPLADRLRALGLLSE